MPLLAKLGKAMPGGSKSGFCSKGRIKGRKNSLFYPPLHLINPKITQAALLKTTFRQASLPGFELGDYVKESIDFLRSHEPPEGYFVGFSGGKDSITTLELCRMAGVKHAAFYSCTRIDPPEMYKFIKEHYPQVTWLFPKKSFWSYLQVKMPPLRTARWCCDYLKKMPSKNIPLKYRIMGIRAEESRLRASRPRIDTYFGKNILIKPIFKWPEWAVWEFIESNKIPYPSLYDEGQNRIGCVVCPFTFGPGKAAQARIKASQNRWPTIWKAFEHAVKRWFSKKMEEGLREGQKWQTPEELWRAYLSGGRMSVQRRNDGTSNTFFNTYGKSHFE